MIDEQIASLVKFNDTKVQEQLTDEAYYNDTFKVEILEPFHVVRTGTAARIVDSIVDHIELGNPQVFCEPIKNTETARDAAIRVSHFCNQMIKAWRLEIADLVRNCVHRGEGILQIQYNPDYKSEIDNGVPLFLHAPDPITTFCKPYDALCPEVVVKVFQMDALSAREIEPSVANFADFVAYRCLWSPKTKYIEVDGKGTESKNIYGFTPFVHCYSGFGKKSSDGRPESLAVGRLRKIRDRLKEECEIESRIDSIISYYANPLMMIKQTDNEDRAASRKSMEDMVIGPGQNVVIPFGFDYVLYTPSVAAAELFQHLYQIRDALGMDNPAIMAGQASGPRTSGRLEDILTEQISRKYAVLVDNVQLALAEILSMGLRLLDTIPKALPVRVNATVIEDGQSINKEWQLTKEDIGGRYNVTVKLNPEEALEADRKIMLYRTLANEGRVSWRRFLVEGMGKTEDEADEIMAEAIAETAMLTDPTIKQMMTEEAIEQIGGQRYLDKLKAQTAEQETMGKSLKENPMQNKGRPSEATNPTAMGIMRQTLGETPVGVRQPPQESV